MNIRVRIERLILEGLPLSGGDAPLVQVAVEAELGRRLAEGGLRPELLAGGALAAVQGDPLRPVEPGAPVALGRGIADAVYGGIGLVKPGPADGRHA